MGVGNIPCFLQDSFNVKPCILLPAVIIMCSLLHPHSRLSRFQFLSLPPSKSSSAISSPALLFKFLLLFTIAIDHLFMLSRHPHLLPFKWKRQKASIQIEKRILFGFTILPQHLSFGDFLMFTFIILLFNLMPSITLNCIIAMLLLRSLKFALTIFLLSSHPTTCQTLPSSSSSPAKIRIALVVGKSSILIRC